MDCEKRSTQVERLEVVDRARRRWSEDEKLEIVLESVDRGNSWRLLGWWCLASTLVEILCRRGGRGNTVSV